jgi:hypothetical protein
MNAKQPVQSTLERANARAWGIATGLVLGLGLLGATLWLVWKDGQQGGEHLGRLSQILPGYSVSVGGAFLGMLYGFVIGYALGRVLAPRQPLTSAERNSERNKHLRLNGAAWSLTLGALFAIAVGGTTAALVARGGEEVGPLLKHLAIYFPGYSVSYGGAALGAAYGFAAGWLIGRLVALVYNATVVRAEERIAAG